MITVVTGIPRSGTSLMMQMLEAGGLDILSDGVRAANEDNPNGYYELENVKLKKYSSWIDEAEGKVIKCAGLQPKKIPPDRYCKFIMMVRDIDEVIASQKKMLKNLNKPYSHLDKLHMVYEKVNNVLLKLLKRNDSFEYLVIDYSDVISNPEDIAVEISCFFPGKNLDVNKMVSVVDKNLYRNRANRSKYE